MARLPQETLPKETGRNKDVFDACCVALGLTQNCNLCYSIGFHWLKSIATQDQKKASGCLSVIWSSLTGN